MHRMCPFNKVFKLCYRYLKVKAGHHLRLVRANLTDIVHDNKVSDFPLKPTADNSEKQALCRLNRNFKL